MIDQSAPRLPPDFATVLRGFYHPYKTASEDLRTLVAACKAHGWTYTAIGEALGVTHERVRQLEAEATGIHTSVPVPSPPVKEKPVRPEPPKLTPEEVRQLNELRRRGQVRRWMTTDHPAYLASAELTRRLWEYRQAGHRLIDLANALGVRTSAIVSRFGTYGYRKLPPSQRPKTGHIRDHQSSLYHNTDEEQQ